MSRALPIPANLDHLKKQAKRRLRELRQRKSDAALTDAQHDVAREYGFASWPKLKAHVESAASGPAEMAESAPAGPGKGGDAAKSTSATDPPPPNYGFDRYTYRARQAVFFARYEAAQVGSATIDPEHVLVGLVRAAEESPLRLFERVGLSWRDARAAIAPPPDEAIAAIPTSVPIPFGTSSRVVLRLAVDEADRLGHPEIGLIHLLLALLENPSAAATVLATRGMTAETLARNVAEWRNEDGPESSNPS